MIARVLSLLFPPRLPGKVENWTPDDPNRSGNWARYFGEQKPATRIYKQQYEAQLRNAEIEMSRVEDALRDQGFVNTIHDVWERPDNP